MERFAGGEKIIAVNGKRFDKVDAWQAMTTDLIGLSEEQAEIVVIGENGKEKKKTDYQKRMI